MVELYHWTDEDTYYKIIRKQNMVESFFSWIFGLEPHELVPGSGGRDEYGEGVYFTDAGPDLARSTIAGRCFGHSSSTDQVECYFLVDFHGNAKISKERAHVWKLSPKTTAKQFIVEHGHHPDFSSDDDDDDDHDDDYDDDYDDDDDDDDDEESSCPWCGDDGFLVTQDDDYEGQRIYSCCAIYYDEDGDLWPADNPMGEGICRCCGDNQCSDDCGKELCRNCCEGYCGDDRHD